MEFLKRISSFNLFELYSGILIQEFVYTHVTTTDANHEFVICKSNFNAFGTELIDAFLLSNEHNLQLVSIRVVIDEISELFIDRVALDWDVNCNLGFKIHAVDFEGFDFIDLVLNLGQ